jgi:hypothetical protein
VNNQTNPTAVPTTTVPPPPGATAPPQALPLAPDGLWAQPPIGSESAIIFFSKNPTGAACISYIFRSTTTQRCATGNQPLVLVTGTIQPGNNKQYTFIAGRTLNGQVSGESVEFADGSSQSIAFGVIIELVNGTSSTTPVSPGGFALVVDGIRKPLDVVSIDQYGNLVGG